MREANKTHEMAPTPTATGKTAGRAEPPRNPLPEKVATRACDANAAARTPPIVHNVPHTTATRALETPAPTSVEIDLDMSFEPFA